MLEIALEHADGELVQLADKVASGDVVLLTRNGREVARLSRASERIPSRTISGAEAVKRFTALQERSRAHWPDEQEFDWKEAVESGRR